MAMSPHWFIGVSTKSEKGISLMVFGVALDCYLSLPPSRQHLSLPIHLEIDENKKTTPRQKRGGKPRKNTMYIRCLDKTKLQITLHLPTSPQSLAKGGRKEPSTQDHIKKQNHRHSTERTFR